MINRQNLLTLLGCSGSLALTLSVVQPAVASSQLPDDQNSDLTPIVQSESNPIQDALTCNCARCLLGQSVSM